MLSSASLHYVLEDCIKKSLIEIPAVPHTHTLHGKCNRAQVHGLPLCFPLRSSLAQVDLTPLSHLDTTHPVTPHHAPCESLFHLSSLPSVAANGGMCYCQLIWPPLHRSVFFSTFGQDTMFLFCSFIMLWFCNFLCAISERPALEKETGLFSMLSAQSARSMTLKRKSP